MPFQCSAQGVDISMEINTSEIVNEDWVQCWYSFRFGDQINFHNQYPEVLTYWEIPDLVIRLTELLELKVTEEYTYTPMEPDFEFIFRPCAKVITLEWHVNFWHEGLTSNYLSVTLDEEQIRQLREYLQACSEELSVDKLAEQMDTSLSWD